jgi:hypothetical protein
MTLETTWDTRGFLGNVGPSREPASDTPAVGPPRQASSYSDTELRSFALAALNMERIRNFYLSKLEAATTPEQQQEVGRQQPARTPG